MSEPSLSSLHPPSFLPDGRMSALTVLSRLALRRPEARGWLAGALDGRLSELAEAGLEAAVETGGPIGSVLAELIKEQAGPRLAERLMLRCEERDYRESVPLLEIAEAVARRHLLFLYGSLPLRSQPGQLLKIATTHNNLGSWQARLGNWREAFSSHQKALTIRKDLATVHNVEEALPDLAAAGAAARAGPD